MVLKRIKEALSHNDEKYEILYYKYSQLKMENKKIKDKQQKEMQAYKEKIVQKMATNLIDLYKGVEETKLSVVNLKLPD